MTDRRLWVFSSALIFILSCADYSSQSTSDPVLKFAAIDAAKIALSQGDCGRALAKITPFYQSIDTDNTVRLMSAAAYGCFAKVNLFKIIQDLVSFSGDFSGSGFWEFIAMEFSSVAYPDDKVTQSGFNATDALLSVIHFGNILLPAYLVNSSSPNPGSLLVGDRQNESNFQLIFVSMSVMGSLLSRYGQPLPNYHKSIPVPWSVATSMKGDGCAFSAGLLHFSDAVSWSAASLSSEIAPFFSSIQSLLNTVLNTGCSLGCTACGLTCTACPVNLRDRTSCSGVATDINSCAAAGIAAVVNASWNGPP